MDEQPALSVVDGRYLGVNLFVVARYPAFDLAEDAVVNFVVLPLMSMAETLCCNQEFVESARIVEFAVVMNRDAHGVSLIQSFQSSTRDLSNRF